MSKVKAGCLPPLAVAQNSWAFGSSKPLEETWASWERNLES